VPSAHTPKRALKTSSDTSRCSTGSPHAALVASRDAASSVTDPVRRQIAEYEVLDMTPTEDPVGADSDQRCLPDALTDVGRPSTAVTNWQGLCEVQAMAL